MAGKAAARVVALLGVSGSGKSIVARRLLHNHHFNRVRFGDAARDMLRSGFGLTDHDIDGPGRDRPRPELGGHTVLNLMHTLSHDWGRGGIHSDLWVHEWKRRIALLTGFVLSDDLQRANEAAAVRDAGGIVVRITRPGYVPAHEAALHRQARIVSDVELVNEGPEALAALADRFVITLTEQLASIPA
jgi:hypothetical protein